MSTAILSNYPHRLPSQANLSERQAALRTQQEKLRDAKANLNNSRPPPTDDRIANKQTLARIEASAPRKRDHFLTTRPLQGLQEYRSKKERVNNDVNGFLADVNIAFRGGHDQEVDLTDDIRNCDRELANIEIHLEEHSSIRKELHKHREEYEAACKLEIESLNEAQRKQHLRQMYTALSSWVACFNRLSEEDCQEERQSARTHVEVHNGRVATNPHYASSGIASIAWK